MKMHFKKDKVNGITLVALVVTIIVMLIIASITVYSGKEIIEKAKLEELKTNMLLIEAKAKEYVEEVNFRMGISAETKPEEEKEAIRNEIYEKKAQLQKATLTDADKTKYGIKEDDICYTFNEGALESWGLDKIELVEGEQYLIVFDEVNAKVEIYNSLGHKGQYSLTEIDKMQN